MEAPINSLLETLILECLVRLHHKDIPSASLVCRKWHDLIRTRHFHTLRKKLGYTNHVACLLQPSHHPVFYSSTDDNFVINMFDPVNQEWNLLPRIRDSRNRFPESTKLVGCEEKLVAMSVYDPDSLEPLTSMFVWDFATHRCWKGKDLPLSRVCYYLVADDHRIFVADGQDRIPGCNKFDTVWVYDVLEDEWNELSRMSQKRGVGEAMIIGEELWVINGCLTKDMGEFEHNAEVYNFETGKWRRVEWGLGVDDSCPYCSFRLEFRGKWKKWAYCDCEVLKNKGGLLQMGEESLLMVSLRLWYWFFQIKYDNVKRMAVPTEFSEYVHSSCCLKL